MFRWFSSLLGFLFFLSGNVWSSDGGVLDHVFPATPEYYRAWPIGPDRDEYLRTIIEHPRTAQAVLDRATPEALWVFSWGDAQLAVSQEEPRRLWIDRDGNRRASPDEITAGTGTSDRYYSTTFTGVSLPVALPDCTQYVPCDLHLMQRSEGAYLYVSDATLDYYHGKLALGGKEYEARLDYRVFYDDAETPRLAPIVVMDTSPDELRDLESDLWFSANGVFPFADRLWQAHTRFSAATAEISLEPYLGPMGPLRVTGLGGHRVHLAYSSSMDNATAPLCGMPIEGDATATHVVPLGDYTVAAAWIISGPTAGYQLSVPSDETPEALRAHVAAGNGAAELPLGGPYELAVAVSRSPLRGQVRLEPGDYKNAAGLSFTAVQRGPRGWTSSQALHWELWKGAEQRVSNGLFSYG